MSRPLPLSLLGVSMSPRLLGGALALALLAHAGVVQAKPAGGAAGPQILNPIAIDPLRLLPPFPVDGSATQAEELAELRRLQATRTPAEFERAKWNAEHEDATAFASAMGPKFDLAKLPATARLLQDVRAEQAAISKRAKSEFHRTRPWVADPAIVGCPHGGDKGKSAYPSGHSTLGYTLAVVMADLAPEQAQSVLARAADYAHDRLVCGAHYRSDVVAGQAMGVAIGVELLRAPALKPELDAARRELATAGVTQAPSP